jgi:hypothetical protein
MSLRGIRQIKGHKYFCNLIKIRYLTSSALMICRASLRGRDRIVPLVVGFVLFSFTVHREIRRLARHIIKAELVRYLILIRLQKYL